MDSDDSEGDSELNQEIFFFEPATDVGSGFIKCSLNGDYSQDSSY